LKSENGQTSAVHGAIQEAVERQDRFYRAVESRDRRFEGHFFTAVKTTGIYCRPGCPAPIPQRKNVCFYASAAAAEQAGFRPCRRCRPDATPGSAVLAGTSATVTRALRLLLESHANTNLEQLAERLGVGNRHLRRLFAEHLGATPSAILGTRRAHFARRLIEETSLSMTQVAMASGYASVRRFNDAIRKTFDRSPSELRARAGETAGGGGLVLYMPYKPPLAWPSLLAFLRARAIPGVEAVTDSAYERTLRMEDGAAGHLRVSQGGAESLAIELTLPSNATLMPIAERVRRMFDLHCDPVVVDEQLCREPRLARMVKARPGLRIPGAWDPFELAIRAVLGQQVSVAGARTLAGRLVTRWGTPATSSGWSCFPTPATIAEAPLEKIGLPRVRAETLRQLARAQCDRRLDWSSMMAREQLAALPGIGAWTVEYIAMRALSEPDAFPAPDLGLPRALGLTNATELSRVAEAWRPWRAYAAMHLWTDLATQTVRARRKRAIQ
jgi:AraC family transcriptional regulator of adaptative response / DNA-3-methyladenine glycosylase II